MMKKSNELQNGTLEYGLEMKYFDDVDKTP